MNAKSAVGAQPNLPYVERVEKLVQPAEPTAATYEREVATSRSYVVPALEIMVNTERIREMIQEPTRTREIKDAILEGLHFYGMVTFDQALAVLDLPAHAEKIAVPVRRDPRVDSGSNH